MADNALKAKQRAAERLARQVEVLRHQGASDKLLKRVGSCTAHYAMPSQCTGSRAHHNVGWMPVRVGSSCSCLPNEATRPATPTLPGAVSIAPEGVACADLLVSVYYTGPAS